MRTPAPNRLTAPAIVSSALFLAGFALSVHLLPRGAVFTVLMAIPLILVAWRWGMRAGLIAAVAGIVYTQSLFSIEYFLVHGNRIDSYWIMTTLEPSLALVVVGAAVGRLSDSLRELKTALDARKRAERAAEETEQRYKSLVDLIPQGVSIVQDSRFVYCNRHMTRTGHSIEELMSRPFTDFNPPEDRQASLELQARALRGDEGDPKAVLRVVGKGGETLWLEVTARKVEWEGRPATICSSADITGRKNAEKALQDSNAHLEAILKAVPDLMFEIDREGRFYSMPTPHPELLVAVPDVYVGKTIRDILPPEAAAVGMQAIEKASETGTLSGTTYSLVTGGEERWYELSISAIGEHASPGAHFIALVRDITDRKRMEGQFAQAQKMEAVGRLAGGIAHDFNNILLVVLGFSDLIAEHVHDAQEVLKDIGVIRESAQRAASLTQQLLAFSRKQMIQPVVRDLNAFLRSTREMLKRMLGEDIEFALSTPEEPFYVSVDPGQLQQVILNLAANARDAMPMGGKLWVETRALEVGTQSPGVPRELLPGRYAVLTVRDTGVGMDDDTLSHIFEPFFTTKEVGKGTGLGLSIVYGTVKQLGGFIYAESQEGIGTSFLVYLPLVDDAIEREIPGGQGDIHGSETILLVEDEDPVRALIARGLKGSGYAVVEAHSGEEALRICENRQTPVHLVLTDVIMPGMRGGQAARRIRELYPEAPIIFMTGYTDQFDELREQLGREPTILRKPFTMRELGTLVAKVLAPLR